MSNVGLMTNKINIR